MSASACSMTGTHPRVAVRGPRSQARGLGGVEKAGRETSPQPGNCHLLRLLSVGGVPQYSPGLSSVEADGILKPQSSGHSPEARDGLGCERIPAHKGRVASSDDGDPIAFSGASYPVPAAETLWVMSGPKGCLRREWIWPTSAPAIPGRPVTKSRHLAGWSVRVRNHASACWYLQLSLGQERTVSPAFLLIFSSRIGEPQMGQGSATGLSQAVNLQSG